MSADLVMFDHTASGATARGSWSLAVLMVLASTSASLASVSVRYWHLTRANSARTEERFPPRPP